MGPTPPEWLQQDALKLGPSSDTGRRSPPAPGQMGTWSRPQRQWLGVSLHPPPMGASPTGKTEGTGSSGQKSQTQDSQGASDCGGLWEGEWRG